MQTVAWVDLAIRDDTLGDMCGPQPGKGSRDRIRSSRQTHRDTVTSTMLNGLA